MSDQEGPKIQIDSDWKAEAQREKERLAAQSKPPGSASSASAPAPGSAPAPESPRGSSSGTLGARSGGGPREMPPANFETLMAMLATQALLYTGAFADPQTGQPMIHLDLARHHIDLLAVLEEKCKGNLTEEEARTLATTLYELRNRYVQVANATRAK